jgi:alkylation response protein AidB-like acyl-CoA dehydrogenase
VINLELSSDQELFRETTRRFLEVESPLSAVRSLADSSDGFYRDLWLRGADLGWTSMLIPEEYGGGAVSGAGVLDLVIVAEEMGRMVAPGPLLSTNVVAAAIAAHGSEEQRDRFLPELAAGRSVASWCLAERGGQWTPDGVELTATKSDDGFVLSGVKTKVEAGAQADILLVTARSPEGLTQFLVPPIAAGITIVPLESLDLVRRFAEVRFDDTQVPASALLGRVGGSAHDVDHQLQLALAIQCAETVGTADRIFDTTREYASDRVSFGRPLASYQVLKHRFADMKLWLEACQATSFEAACSVQTRSQNSGKLTSTAKAYVGRHATEIIQQCVQLHGGIAMTWDHDIHLYLRRATVNRSMYGTPAQHLDRLVSLQ